MTRRRAGLGMLARGETQRSGVRTVTGNAAPEQLREVSVDAIETSPWQPRTRYDESELDTLADSIREHGILEPLLARALSSGELQLVAGHRRLKAAQRAGLETVPVRVMDLDDLRARAATITENLARADLAPIEEARAVHALEQVLKAADEEATVARLAQLTGRSTGSVSMSLTISRGISEHVVSATGLEPAEVAGLTQQALYIAARTSEEERPQLLTSVVKKSENRSSRAAALREAVPKMERPPYEIRDELSAGSFRLQLRKAPGELKKDEARQILERLEPLLLALKKRVEK